MKQVAIALRALQLFAHNAHNLAKGPTFVADHDFLGDLYKEYEDSYDAIVERMIGEGEKIDLTSITEFAADLAGEGSLKDCDAMFTHLCSSEEGLREVLGKAMKGASEGTANLLQDLADESLDRCYKIGRRLSK